MSSAFLTSSVAPKRKIVDKLFRVVCLLAVVTACLFLFLLLWSVVRDGLEYLSPSFFNNWASRTPELAGIRASLYGTLWVMVVTASVSIPVGVAAAVYLELFTSQRSRLTNFIQLNIANLAGVPSIVYGLLGLAIFVRLFGFERSVLAAGLTMSLLVLPMIIVVSQEAIRAVPISYRDGSMALGATQWYTAWKLILPAAFPGIITAIIIDLSRAIGETAPLVVVGAVTFIASTPDSLSSKFTVLPVQIYHWAGQPQVEFHKVAASGIIVILSLLLLLNSVAIYIRARKQRTV